MVNVNYFYFIFFIAHAFDNIYYYQMQKCYNSALKRIVRLKWKKYCKQNQKTKKYLRKYLFLAFLTCIVNYVLQMVWEDMFWIEIIIFLAYDLL